MIRYLTICMMALVFTACTQDNSTRTQNAGGAPADTISQTDDIFDDKYVSSEDSARNYCSGEASVYRSDGWTVSATGDWRQRTNVTTSSNLTLVNNTERLLFTTGTEQVNGTVEQYIANRISNLKSDGVSGASSTNSTVSGRNYQQIVAPGNNFSNWQWLTFKDGVAHIISCGSPKGANGNYDACLDLVESTDYN